MGTPLTGLECRFKRFLKPCIKGPAHITEHRMPTQVAEAGVIQGWH